MKNSTPKSQPHNLKLNRKRKKLRTGEPPEPQDENEQNAPPLQNAQKGEMHDLTEQPELAKDNIIYAYSEL